MSVPVTEAAGSDRQERRQIARTSRLVREALGSPQTSRWTHEGRPCMVVDSYICAPSAGVTFPKLPLCVIGFLLEGKKVRNLRALDSARDVAGDTLITMPNRCVVLPQGVVTHWRPTSGSINIVGVYVCGSLAQEALKAMTRGTTRPKPVRDAVLAALIRQLLEIANVAPGSLPPNYEKHLVDAFVAQLQWLALDRERAERTQATYQDVAVSKALRLVEEHLDQRITIDWLCEAVGVSSALFRRRFRAATGRPVHQFILASRVERARELIEETSLPFSLVASHCGFSSQSHMTAAFRRVTGVTPSELRRGEDGQAQVK